MNIFAGNLAKDVTEEDLRTAFRAFGSVAFVNIVRDRTNRASIGFGYLQMPDQAQAEAAILALHGKTMKGQAIIVNEAAPKPR